jgi:FkbM family methyltransferase
MIKHLAKKMLPATVWLFLSHMRTMFRIQRRTFLETAAILGFHSTVTISLSKMCSWTTAFESSRLKKIRCIRLPGYQYPLYYREGTSDLEVIRQIFVRREYESIGNENDISLIVDCGANIGCTAFYLLNRYPEAHVIVVEPDSANFAICRKNLLPFTDRVTLVKAGIWSSSIPLCVERGNYGDGREWSFQVRPIYENERADFLGVTIDQLLENADRSRIDILKIDIEAAERELFSENYRSWLDRTKNIVIELHGEDCERAFLQAMAKYCWEPERSGELTVCRNIKPAKCLSVDPVVP